MSRAGDGDGEELFPNQWALWHQAFDRARNSARGLRALEDLRDALHALPEKRLISRALCTVGKDAEIAADKWGDRKQIVEEQGIGVCTVGAYAWWKRVQSGMTHEEAFASLPFGEDTDDPSLTVEVGEQAGLARTLGWWLMAVNDDDLSHLPADERYAHVLAKVERLIEEHPARVGVDA